MALESYPEGAWAAGGLASWGTLDTSVIPLPLERSHSGVPAFIMKTETVQGAEEGADRRRGIFFGWWIVASGVITGVLRNGSFGMGAGAFFLPIAREFETTRAAVSWAFALVRIEGGLLGPLEGWLIDHFGPRKMMLFGWVVFGLGFILMSLVQSINQFYAAFIITAIGTSFSGFLPMAATIVNWFSRWRGTALGIVLAGNSIGGVLVPLVVLSIETFGWRATAAGSGVLMMALGIPLSLVVRRRPEDYGMLPDGVLAREDYSAAAAQSPAAANGAQGAAPSPSGGTDQDEGLTVGQAIRTPAFWLLAMAHNAGLTAWAAVSVHLIPALVDNGLSEAQAASIVGVMAVIATIGRLAGGLLGDRFGAKPMLIMALLMQAAAMLMLSVTTTWLHALLFAAIMGIGFGARGPIQTSLRSDLFGRRSFATITGATEPLIMVGSVAATVLTGVAFDIQHSYKLAFIIIAAVNILGILFVLPIRRPHMAVAVSPTPA